MRVERVRYFQAAARLGSLRAAADEVGISQQSLGAQIELLEEELDTVLLTRTRRGVTPTTAGESLLPAVQGLISAEESLHETAQHLRGDYEGSVRIGSVPTLASALVGPVVARLLKHHSGLKFTVIESTSREIEQRVSEGSLDLGVLTQPTYPAPPPAERQILFATSLVACLPPSHRLASHRTVSWDDLASQPLVSMRAGTTLWDTLHRHVDEPRIVVQAASMNTVRHLVARGAGVGIEAPLGLGEEHQDDAPAVVRRPLVGADTTIPSCLTHNGGTQPSRAAVTVRQVIVSETARLRGATIPTG